MTRLEPGDSAPSFTLRDHDGVERSLDDYAGRKLVIYFYPRAFTPGCTTQACDFRDNYQAFSAKGFEVIGVSPDEPGKLAEFRDEHDLPFPLLADPEHEVAERYGAWGTKTMYGKTREGLIRSTIVIDEAGTVTDAMYNVRARGHVERVGSDLL